MYDNIPFVPYYKIVYCFTIRGVIIKDEGAEYNI